MGRNIFVFKFLPMEDLEVTGINFEPTIVLGYCWSMDLLHLFSFETPILSLLSIPKTI